MLQDFQRVSDNFQALYIKELKSFLMVGWGLRTTGSQHLLSCADFGYMV